MRIKIIFVLVFSVIQLFIGNMCNIPETITIFDAEIVLPPDTGAIYKFTKFYFILVPGDTALFYGTHNCTISVNGIITHCINDSAYLRTITREGVTIDVDDSLHFVYPQLYQQSSTFKEIHDNTITRYLEKSDSATLQVAYEENGKISYLDKKKLIVMPRTLVIGPYAQYVTDSTDIPTNNTWPASPLIKCPIVSTQGTICFDGYSVATKVINLPKSGENPYIINGNEYRNGIFVKSYYIISGETIEDDKIVHIAGTTIITRTYFTERGMIDQLTLTSIQKIFSDGSVERIRETIYVARGPEGAKKYSENTDTLRNVIPW